VVNCAGSLAAEIGILAGVQIPVKPKKRCIFVVKCEGKPIDNCPLLIDPSGVYVRPEGSHFICGVAPPETNDPDAYGDFSVDYALFDEVIWPALADRIPSFEALKLVNAWAGHYDFNTFDHNAILGLHPDFSNLYLANGFSGHGLQQSPAVGRALSEIILAGAYTTLDLSCFSVSRVTENKPVTELNVV